VHVAVSDSRLPDLGDVYCCAGMAMGGAGRCTCWEPVFAEEQRPIVDGLSPTVADAMCVDCAYRPGSPERSGHPQAAGDQDLLDQLVRDGTPFWCHQGIRRPVGYLHPAGVGILASGLEYTPPTRDGVPYRADGTPADYCAGWAARTLHEGAFAPDPTPTGGPA
jgi:hypothetical protein